MYDRATITGVRVQHFLYPPGASVSSVRPCHNTRNFCEFCNTSIPVPETAGSSVRLPYPYPESTNPTEHNLGSVACIYSTQLYFKIVKTGYVVRVFLIVFFKRPKRVLVFSLKKMLSTFLAFIVFSFFCCGVVSPLQAERRCSSREVVC